MASHFDLRAVVDPRDRAAFHREIESILTRYGDQPHLRKLRDRELEQAVETYAACFDIQVVPHG